MTFLKKTITPNVEMLVNEGASVSFVLRVKGLDPIRPDSVKTVPIDAAHAAVLLQNTWDAVEPPKG